MAKQPRLAAGRARALGLPTRGTTNPNRLRRVDRWISVAPTTLSIRTSDRLTDDLGIPSARAAPETLPASAIRAKIRRSVRSSIGGSSSFQKWNGVS